MIKNLLLLLLLLMILLCNISMVLDLKEIRQSMQSTRSYSIMTSELIQYWFPPIQNTRMKNNCARCHR